MLPVTWYAALAIDASNVIVGLSRVTGGGRAELVATRAVEMAGVRDGVVVDASMARAGLAQALSWARTTAGVPITTVCLLVPDAHLLTCPASGVVSWPRATRVNRGTIALARRRALAQLLPQGTIVAAAVERLVVDGRTVERLPVGKRARSLRVDCTAWLVPHRRVEGYREALEPLGVDVGLLLPHTLAEAYASVDQTDRMLGVTFVAIAPASTVVVTLGQDVVLDIGILPVGEDAVIDAMAADLAITVPEARAVYADLLRGGQVSARRMMAGAEAGVVAAYADLFVAVRQYLAERRLLPYLTAGTVLTGRARYLPAVVREAGHQLDLPVRTARPPAFLPQSGARTVALAGLTMAAADVLGGGVARDSQSDRSSEAERTRLGGWLRVFVPSGGMA